MLIVRNRGVTMVRVGNMSIAPGRSVEMDEVRYNSWLDVSDTNRHRADTMLTVETIRTDDMPVVAVATAAADSEIEGLLDLMPDIKPVDRDKVEVLAASIAHIDTADDGNWLRTGEPTLGALRAASGTNDLTAEERNLAWDVYRGYREE